MTTMLRSGRVLRGKSATVGPRSLRIIASSGVQARDGLALNQYKWKLPRSGRCPLVNSHGDALHGVKSVLGNCDDFEVRTVELNTGGSGPCLLATANFAEADISAEAELALQLYRGEYLDSFSVSFMPDWTDAPSPITPGAQELAEISCVAVPADTNAVVLSRAIRRQLRGSSLTLADRRAILEARLRKIDRGIEELERAGAYETREDRLARLSAIIGRN